MEFWSKPAVQLFSWQYCLFMSGFWGHYQPWLSLPSPTAASPTLPSSQDPISVPSGLPVPALVMLQQSAGLQLSTALLSMDMCPTEPGWWPSPVLACPCPHGLPAHPGTVSGPCYSHLAWHLPTDKTSWPGLASTHRHGAAWYPGLGLSPACPASLGEPPWLPVRCRSPQSPISQMEENGKECGLNCLSLILNQPWSWEVPYCALPQKQCENCFSP